MEIRIWDGNSILFLDSVSFCKKDFALTNILVVLSHHSWCFLQWGIVHFFALRSEKEGNNVNSRGEITVKPQVTEWLHSEQPGISKSISFINIYVVNYLAIVNFWGFPKTSLTSGLTFIIIRLATQAIITFSSIRNL